MKAKLMQEQTIFSLSILVESQGPGGIPFVLLHAHTGRERCTPPYHNSLQRGRYSNVFSRALKMTYMNGDASRELDCGKKKITLNVFQGQTQNLERIPHYLTQPESLDSQL